MDYISCVLLWYIDIIFHVIQDMCVPEKHTFHDRCTFCEWIASVTFVTDADGIVFYDIAICVYTAWAWAQIHALLVLARQVSGTPFIYDTLGATIWRPAHIIRQTRACRETIDYPTLGIRSTRRGNARIAAWSWCWCYFHYNRISMDQNDYVKIIEKYIKVKFLFFPIYITISQNNIL